MFAHTESHAHARQGRGKAPTRFLDLGLAGFGGRHDPRGGLGDAPGRLLQAGQVGAVLVRLHLGDRRGCSTPG